MLWEQGTEALCLLEMAEKGRRTKLKSKTERYKVLSGHVNKSRTQGLTEQTFG